MTKREIIEDLYDDVLFMDDYDDCIVGIMERFGMDPVVVYDKQKILSKLISEGMSDEEAYEFFEFNQLGAWVGEFTPAFIDFLDLE
jgi:biotin synthase-related radical SAM superfamily protein